MLNSCVLGLGLFGGNRFVLCSTWREESVFLSDLEDYLTLMSTFFPIYKMF